MTGSLLALDKPQAKQDFFELFKPDVLGVRAKFSEGFFFFTHPCADIVSYLVLYVNFSLTSVLIDFSKNNRVSLLCSSTTHSGHRRLKVIS